MIFRYCNEKLFPSFMYHYLFWDHIVAPDVWASRFVERTKEQIKKVYSSLPHIVVSICSCSQLTWNLFPPRTRVCVYVHTDWQLTFG